MVRLTVRQRSALAGTLRELANYGVAALVFGQFVGDLIVSWRRLLVGAVIWIGFVAFALVLEGE